MATRTITTTTRTIRALADIGVVADVAERMVARAGRKFDWRGFGDVLGYTRDGTLVVIQCTSRGELKRRRDKLLGEIDRRLLDPNRGNTEEKLQRKAERLAGRVRHALQHGVIVEAWGWYATQSGVFGVNRFVFGIDPEDGETITAAKAFGVCLGTG